MELYIRKEREMQFRTLRADEIDVRVASINKNGCSLLLYKDARVDQNILDETFGIYGWQREHQLIGDRLYCTVKVQNPDTEEWISKQDVGVESYTEKEKGQASDAFKRACFNFGIGRELYTAPFVWVGAEHYNVSSNKEGKPTTYDRFKVQEIAYKGGKIIRLVIVNDSRKGETVFVYGKEPVKEKISAQDVTAIKMACMKENLSEKTILNKYHISSLEELTVSDYTKGSDDKKSLKEWVDESTRQTD